MKPSTFPDPMFPDPIPRITLRATYRCDAQTFTEVLRAALYFVSRSDGRQWRLERRSPSALYLGVPPFSKDDPYPEFEMRCGFYPVNGHCTLSMDALPCWVPGLFAELTALLDKRLHRLSAA